VTSINYQCTTND